MIKYTLNFSNPAHLFTKKNQLVVELRDEKRTTINNSNKILIMLSTLK